MIKLYLFQTQPTFEGNMTLKQMNSPGYYVECKSFYFMFI